MGSPEDEPERTNDLTRHPEVIDHQFAIAAKEVSVADYQKFVGFAPGNQGFGLAQKYLDRYSPRPDGPMVGVSWYGAAASDDEDLWRRQRVERPEKSILFEAADRRQVMVVEDAQTSDLVRPNLVRLFNLRSLIALPLLVADGPPIGVVVLAERDRLRSFTAEEVLRASSLTQQAALAIQNAQQITKMVAKL